MSALSIFPIVSGVSANSAMFWKARHANCGAIRCRLGNRQSLIG